MLAPPAASHGQRCPHASEPVLAEVISILLPIGWDHQRYL